MTKKIQSAAKAAKGNFKSIHWPKPKEAVSRTFLVLAFSVVAGGIIAVVDSAAGQTVGAILSLFG